jgi:hypothetical protein
MRKQRSLGFFVLLLSTSITRAQDLTVAQAHADGSVRLLVAVTTKTGQPVTDLREQDFTVFDGDVIRQIIWFRPVPMNSSTARTSPIYELTFDGARSSGHREFHEVGIRVDRPDLKVITRQGYLTSAN